MNETTAEKTPPHDARTAADSASSHPFDNWLRRELKARYVEFENQPLPPDLAELAGQLEARLSSAARRHKKIRDPG